MSKKLISKAIFEATNLKARDATLLAEHILIRIREKLIKDGRFSLPGVGTFFSTGQSRHIKATDLAYAIGERSAIPRAQAKEITQNLIEILKTELSTSSSLSIHGLGDFVLTKNQTTCSAVHMDTKRDFACVAEPEKQRASIR